jgi:protein-S-isoprenylcysteine O-methyltransferase Ste14
MTWFGVYFALVALMTGAALRLVPKAHRLAYAYSEKPWDYKAAAVAYWSIAAVAFFWPGDVATLWRVCGAALYCGGNGLVIWAWRVNPFFIPAVKRPLWVVESGPYAFCSHPGYIGFAAASLGVALMLGGDWAVIPVAAYWALLARRVWVEGRMLSCAASTGQSASGLR